MKEEWLLELFRQYKNNQLEESELLDIVSQIPFEQVGEFAKIDHHRNVRQGSPEVIYCPGKSNEEIVEIVRVMRSKESDILATRADISVFEEIQKLVPEAKFFKRSKAIVIEDQQKEKHGSILVISAGTSDIPVAEEAVVTASFMGSKVEHLYDVGVAGIHRLLGNIKLIRKAHVIVVVAGMDGALPSVVGGLVSTPVIAVPTSVGYGASFGGISALLAMLNSCATGISVVNIDNGFGAGAVAHRINIQTKNDYQTG